MANWWDAAPVVEKPKRNFWDDAPVVQPGPDLPPPSNRAPVDDIARRADAAERVSGTNSFSDMTGGAAAGIPFSDEIYSAVSALPNAAINAFRGNGFDPVQEYRDSQAVQAELARRREERSPIASTVGAVAGGLALGGNLAGNGLSLLRGAQPTISSLLGRGAAEGAAYGAAYGAGEGEGIADRASNALTSAAIGAGTGAIGGAVARIGARGVDDAAIPSRDELRAAGEAAYKAADEAGVMFTPNAVSRLQAQIQGRLTDMGYDPALQPGAAAVVRRLGELSGQNVSLRGIETLRRVAGNGYVQGNKSNNKAIGEIIDEIDNVVANPATSDVLMGDAAAGSAALRTARDMWSRLSKSDRVNYEIAKGELRAASTGSGGNADNAVRQNLRRVLENPRGFTQAEQQALRTAVVGTPTQNGLRLAGKLSPSGNGLMAALGIGGAMVNPLIGVASLGGMGAKAVADGMTRRNANLVQQLIRSGGDLPQAQLSGPRKAIADALLRTGLIAAQ